MSFNKHYRQAWITTVYAEAVSLFHEARKAEINADVPLVDLARQSANTAFQERAAQIVGDKETLAREFMAHCREHFDKEVAIGVAARAQTAIQTTQVREARAS